MPKAKESMFKTQEELKDFITWAIEKRLARVRVGDVEVDISALAYIDSVPVDGSLSQSLSPSRTYDETITPEQQAKEDEELLYHSSIP